MNKKKNYYKISTVADRFDIHPQTLRIYEKKGLLNPDRTEGNTRLYSDADIERLEIILNLTDNLGVNLAGVEVILNMRKKMLKMHREVDRLIEYVKTIAEERQKDQGTSIVKSSSTEIIKIVKENDDDKTRE